MAQRLATAVRHPLASAASTPPQLPLGDENPRNDEELPLGDKTPGTKGRASPAGEHGIIDAAPASFGGQNPEDHRRASLGGQNPRDKNNDNSQPLRVRSHNDNKNNKNHGTQQGSWAQRIMDTGRSIDKTTKRTPNHQG